MTEDEKKYCELMSQYKIERRKGRGPAAKLLAQAMQLAKEGDVSQDVIIGMAYL
jgi:hypothetical protein